MMQSTTTAYLCSKGVVVKKSDMSIEEQTKF